MKLRLIILILLTTIANLSFAQSDPGGIDGKIIDEKGQPVPFASVGAFEGGILKGQTKSDLNGNYQIKPLNAGVYTLQISSVGFDKMEIENLRVNAGRSFTTNVTMQKKGNIIKTVRIKSGPPLIRADEPGTSIKTKEEITKMATVDAIDAAGTIGGVNQGQRGGGLSMSGDRTDGTMYLVDGMMMRGSAAIRNLAPGSIRSMEVFRSGLSAKYGNATGGVVSVNTTGVTSTTSGGIQAQTSVDGYFNNLVALNLSGPLMFKKDSNGVKTPVLGYVLSVSGRYNKD